MLPTSLWVLCLAAVGARSQTTNSELSFTNTFSTLSSVPTSDFTASQYTYITATEQSTVSSSSSSLSFLNGAANSSATTSGSASATSQNSQVTVSSSTQEVFGISGLPSSARNGTATASSTSSAALPVNTLPCNNYPEFCNRRYSNITEVCAHNSAFAIKNNAASNQALSITTQLDDGIRMLQGETHRVNDTIYNCHSSCNLLNAGTWQASLETLVSWLERNPYDVVTWLIVNSDFVWVENYTAAVENSGIMPYLYTPQYVPQRRDQWPTLGEMILSGKRVVMFMDYNANQKSVPYILDQFSHIWETPFSPTNQSFPCTQQRPPGLNQTVARDDYMYLANHNLNTPVDVGALTGGSSSEAILIPNFAELNLTNGQFDQFGQLGAMNQNCTAQWERPPNFLLVDYYNMGLPGPGSVFEVAARANNVTYNRPCCGVSQSGAPMVRSSFIALAAAVIFSALLSW